MLWQLMLEIQLTSSDSIPSIGSMYDVFAYNWLIFFNDKSVGKYMGVSENRGTPKSSILIGFSITNHPFWGTTIVGNPHISPMDLFLGYQKIRASSGVSEDELHQGPRSSEKTSQSYVWQLSRRRLNDQQKWWIFRCGWKSKNSGGNPPQISH